jgi:hypothetical protein
MGGREEKDEYYQIGRRVCGEGYYEEEKDDE